MEDELQARAVEARAKAEERLKDRQTQERQIMLDLLAKNTHVDNNTVQQYLEKEKKDAEKELKKYKLQKAKEKEDLLKELEAAKLRREEEFRQKEEQMLNWEEKVKQEEAKTMAGFQK